MGARVNGRLVSLETPLQNGDVVEVFTSKDPNAGPNKSWLDFVKSKRAQNKIRQWFTKERREEDAESGKVEITKALRKQGLPLHQVMNSDGLQQVALQLRYADVTALYAAVGAGHVSAQSVVEKVTALLFDEQTSTEPALATLPIIEAPRASKVADSSGIVVKGASGVLAKLAKCCTPVPGDEVMGFVTKADGVSVHRVDCHNFQNLREQQDRVVEVEWAPSTKSVFLVQIQIEALDRAGLLSDITRSLSEHHVNILSASVNTSTSRLAISKFVFEMANSTHLDHVLNARAPHRRRLRRLPHHQLTAAPHTASRRPSATQRYCARPFTSLARISSAPPATSGSSSRTATRRRGSKAPGVRSRSQTVWAGPVTRRPGSKTCCASSG